MIESRQSGPSPGRAVPYPEVPMPAASRQRKSRHVETSRNFTKKQRAAILLAEDELSDENIAAEVGVSRRTLATWKLDPEFAAQVGDYTGKIIADALRLPIAKKHKRIAELNDLNERYHRIIEARAERYAAALADSPETAARAIFGDVTPAEAATGMLVAQPKIAANGKTVTEWAFDKSLDSAIKETHKQAATELGQWVEKSEQDQRVGITRRYILEDDE